jgi:hypothetical protein
MSLAKDRDGARSERAASRRRRKPVMIGAQRVYAAEPLGDLDYAALCDEINRRFPLILKRLAE